MKPRPCLRTAAHSIVLVALLLTFFSSEKGQAVEAPSPYSQRVQQLDRLGGLVTASLPRPDGSVLAAQGSTLVQLDVSTNPARVLGRADLGHGAILALAETPAHALALTEDGIVVLAGAGLPKSVSFTPGGGQALAAAGDLIAVAAVDAGLRLLRVSPVGVAEPLSNLSLPGKALDVTLEPGGALAFVAGGPRGVHQVDLSDPAAPRLLQTLDAVTPTDAVALAGSLLAVGSRGRVSLVDPASDGQSIVGLYAPLRDGRRMVIDDEFAYIADAHDGLKIVWLAAPDRPVQVYGEADQPVADLWIEGTVAYVVGQDGLRILDVSNRYRPLEIGHLPITLPSDQLAGPQAVAVADGRAFIALGEDGLAVVDVTNWATPRLTGLMALEGSANAVLYRDGFLFVASGDAGLAIVDARLPGAETLVDVFPLPGIALDLARRGDALYVAAQEAGLIALDILRPASPVIRGVLPPDTGESILSVFISGKRAFLSEGDGFTVADVALPNHLGRLARIDGPAEYVVTNDITLYALSNSQIAIYDARATAGPVYQRTYTALSQIGRITVRGDTALVTSAAAGPDAVALSLLAPDYPYELDSIGQTGSTYSVSFSAGRVYLAAGFGGLRAYDVSEGGALIPRSRYHTLPETSQLAADGRRMLAGGRMGWSVVGAGESGDVPVRDLAIDGDTVAVAAGDTGVALYHLTDTQEPVLLARQPTSGPALGVALDDRFVYVAGLNGLSIYDRLHLSSVRRVSTPAPAQDVALRSGLAYLPLEDGSLAVIEVGDPFGGLQRSSSVEMSYPADLVWSLDGRTVYALAATTLQRLGTDSRGRLYADQTGALLEVAERGAFLQDGVLAAFMPGQAVHFVDISQLETQTSIIGRQETTAQDVVLNWPVGYAAYGEQGLGLIDIRSRTTGSIFYPESVQALYRQGDRLFALGESLTVWDVGQPAQPGLLARLPVAASGRHIDPACIAGCSSSEIDLLLSLETGIAVAHWDGTTLTETANVFADAVDRAAWLGKHGYLALHNGGLLVVDLSNLTQPVNLFTYTSPSGKFVNDLLPLDNDRLLVSWESGIDMLEVGTGAGAPQLLTAVPSKGSQALSMSLSSDGSQAAVALGEEGAALFSLADPRHPQMVGHVDTPGAGLAVALDASTLYIADGLCGLRVFDTSDPAHPAETGYWQGGYASDMLIRQDSAGQMVVSLAGANQIVNLRYDAALPPVLPPIPQSPEPAGGQSEVPLALALQWGPPADSCNPTLYDVYFGQGDNPPLLGQVSGNPQLEVPDLTPLRSYSWRVEATDRQGDRVMGPLWRFTTVATEFANTTPPAPPTFLAWVEEHPLVSVGLGCLVLGSLIFLALRWLRPHKQTIPIIVPEWYSTHEEEQKDS